MTTPEPFALRSLHRPPGQLSCFHRLRPPTASKRCNIQRHQLIDNHGQTVQTFQPELTDLQQQILDLLHIPASVYSSTDTS